MYTFEWRQLPKDVSFKNSDGASVTKTIAPKFEGTIKIKVPKHVERIKLIRDLNTKVESTGALVNGEMDSTEKMLEFAKKNIEVVSLKRIEDGCEVKTVEWLEYDVEGAEILGEISQVLLQGVKLGKS